MKNKLHIVFLMGLLAATHWVAIASSLLAEELNADDIKYRHYWLDASLFSLRPNEEMASYRSHGAGGVGPNGTLGLGGANQERQFNVSIRGQLKSNRFVVDVAVKPAKEDKQTRAQKLEYDFSDLTPRTIELARDEDGRVFRVNLAPSIKEYGKPRQFNAKDLRLDTWSFPSCPVIVNDADYIGRLGMSYGTLASCDIAGLAKIEFSLLHLKDAEPLGTLENGIINIRHADGTTLRISDVKNGSETTELAGGPYRVWVRWKKPSQTIEEYRDSLKKQIASIKKRVENGELTLAPESIANMEKKSQSATIGLSGNELRQARADEIIESDE